MNALKIPKKEGTANFSLPVFGLGTWMMGGASTRDPNNDDEGDMAAIKRAIQRGITHIDTAEMYAGGYAEEMLGKVIKECQRKELIIASKVWSTNLRYDDLLRSAEQSLRRLNTDYIDLYYIHKPNDEIPLKETMLAMNQLVDQGLIRYIGLSNFSVERTKAAAALANTPITVVQVHYNLIYREPARVGLLDYCVANNILLVAWRPVQKGLLAENPPPLLQTIAKAHKKTPAQIAINWLISQPNVVTLSTMRNPAHLEENLGALDFSLTTEEMRQLTENFPNQQEKSDVVPLL